MGNNSYQFYSFRSFLFTSSGFYFYQIIGFYCPPYCRIVSRCRALFYSTSHDSGDFQTNSAKKNHYRDDQLTYKFRLTNEQKLELSNQLRKNQDIQSVITGMLLSDACLSYSGKSKDTRLEIMQQDKDYVFHLYALFKPLGIVLAEPMVRLSKNQSTKNMHT
jgi:hypothetical protein